MKRKWLAFLSAVQFLTRLPVPDPGWEDGRLDRAAKWFPLVGALVGLICGVVLYLIGLLSYRGLPLVELSVLFGVLITGALHEDGFADTADGFFGGRDSEKRLSIMRDSRIGTYGAIALIFAILLRISLYEEFYSARIASASFTVTIAAAFIAAHAMSRTLMLLHLSMLPYARGEDAALLSPLSGRDAVIPVITVLIVCLPLAHIVSYGAVAAGIIVAIISSVAFTKLTKTHIGGWTGDTAGATQIISEIFFLIGFCAWIWS